MATERLTATQARRRILAAQGFRAQQQAEAPVSRAALSKGFDRLNVLQIDSVTALCRSHYVPLFSRLGCYRAGTLDGITQGRKRRTFEYWGHEASHLPLDLWPVFGWRRRRAQAGIGLYKGLQRFSQERPEIIGSVADEVASLGTAVASDLTCAPNRGKGNWWGWSEAKIALEYLFWTGRITTHERRGFERVYAPSEQVIPAPIFDQADLPEAEALRLLLHRSLDSLGVATAEDLLDYFRLPKGEGRAALAELAATGEIQPVEVKGWDRPAYTRPDLRSCRGVPDLRLLSPFDNLVFCRPRTLRAFGFDYKLEFYVPQPKRRFGYYVMPMLWGDRLVGRVDVRADRASGSLRVPAAYAEAGEALEPLAEALAASLRRLADWQGLDEIRIEGDGELDRRLLRLEKS